VELVDKLRNLAAHVQAWDEWEPGCGKPVPEPLGEGVVASDLRAAADEIEHLRAELVAIQQRFENYLQDYIDYLKELRSLRAKLAHAQERICRLADDKVGRATDEV